MVKESLGAGAQARKPPTGQNGGSSVKSNGGWDDWDDDCRSSSDMRRNQSAGDFRPANVSGMRGGGQPSRSRSQEDIYTRSQLEASAANKESFFARKMQENESRPEGLPPSQGGKYVGFGSMPAQAPRNNNHNSHGDVMSVVSQVRIWCFHSLHSVLRCDCSQLPL